MQLEIERKRRRKEGGEEGEDVRNQGRNDGRSIKNSSGRFLIGQCEIKSK